jgi:predicted phosphoadenosine phosphosulfate sulfurtransferase
MSDPFKIDDLTCISFSGGRTSAYMLWRVLQSNGGLPSNAKILFANTGKECEETLDFVNDCATHWGVAIGSSAMPMAWVRFNLLATSYWWTMKVRNSWERGDGIQSGRFTRKFCWLDKTFRSWLTRTPRMQACFRLLQLACNPLRWMQITLTMCHATAMTAPC